MLFTSHDVAVVRHVVQHILVPCVFLIGLLGNSVSIYVLTRKRMRCTTNIYLTALAITDLIYLTMALLLSFQHYAALHHCCKFYWLTFGIVHWLCDACAYISIYTAVCFTVERFIAIRYPLKRQTFCTESLAKNVITGVTIFCLISTISTAFEHDFITTYRLIDSSGQPCNQLHLRAATDAKEDMTPSYFDLSIAVNDKNGDNKNDMAAGMNGDDGTNNTVFLTTSLPEALKDHDVTFKEHLIAFKRDQYSQQLHKQNDNATSISSFMNIPIQENLTVNALQNDNDDDDDESAPVIDKKLMSIASSHQVSNSSSTNIRNSQNTGDNHLGEIKSARGESADYMASSPSLLSQLSPKNSSSSCHNVTYYEHIASALGENDLYIKIWYFLTLFIFVLMPLCMLATFNTFLILLVRKSKAIRGRMTNAHSIRRTRKSNSSMSVSQENRVTVTLIAVVLLFIVCQLPWAIYLIVSEQIDIANNTRIIIGNIFNFLSALNAAGNFFLYCVLSDKYRKMVRELITGNRSRRRRPTVSSNGASLYVNGRRSSYRPTSTSVIVD